MRVKGHTLKYRGRVGMAGRLLPNAAGAGHGAGRAECVCGTFSPVLPNTHRRQRWHREHKADVASERGLAAMTKAKGEQR